MQDDLEELEKRVAQALARIGSAVEGMGGPDGVPRETHEAALDTAERLRVEAVDATKRADTAEAEIARLKEALEAEATANAQLRERNAALKAAKDDAIGKADALERETAVIREARGADREELDGILAALEPLVKEHSDA